jgi:hypothetical protein
MIKSQRRLRLGAAALTRAPEPTTGVVDDSGRAVIHSFSGTGLSGWCLDHRPSTILGMAKHFVVVIQNTDPYTGS